MTKQGGDFVGRWGFGILHNKNPTQVHCGILFIFTLTLYIFYFRNQLREKTNSNGSSMRNCIFHTDGRGGGEGVLITVHLIVC